MEHRSEVPEPAASGPEVFRLGDKIGQPIPDGHHLEIVDYDVATVEDRLARFVPDDEPEYREALRRQEERRQLLASAPKGRLVRAVRAVRAVVPRRSNGSSGRPKASSARSSSRSGDSPGDDDADGPGEAGRVVARIRAWWRAIRDAWAMRGHADLDEQLDDALSRDAWASRPAEWWSLDDRGVTELYDDEPA